MTSYLFSHYGRGGAKLVMPRPNVEWQEIKITRSFFITGWIYFIKDTVSLIYHIRFFLIIFLIILILTNIMISMKFIINKSPLKVIHQQAVNFIFQPEPPEPKLVPAPLNPVIPKPKIKEPEPDKSEPKPKEKNPLNLEASLNIEKNFVQEQKESKKHQTRRIIPKAKEQLDLKTSLNIEKDFVKEPKQVKARHVRRVAANPAEDKLTIKNSLDIEKDFVTEVKRIKIPNMHRTSSIPLEKEELTLPASFAEKQDFIQVATKTDNAVIKHKRNNNTEEIDDDYEEIHVQAKDMDFADFENNSRQITNDKNMIIRSDRVREEIKGVQFAIKGKSLETLKGCGRLEADLKIRLAKLVQKKDYIKKCVDRTGKYLFFWPKGRFTASNFNVIIYPAMDRKVTDRCEELNYAINCLKKY